ncbi:hypothetical protein [Novosphingopyxis sp. YJ-S2-01]|uniref:hypothetical protein n=1 Tax=Novosphingopyxis sp. YJ-S2-01 TaxID=2794021 RepID=UPI0018DE2333|nr:hypothetical protein [Novosphingopyxis sp. YJ-S2-01]MBH9537898.1 hypothetical protein [Novosphingopyxis sp. YJ-S2-01]
MARKGKGYQGLMRRRTDEQAVADHNAKLQTLKSLCEDYDQGRIEYVFLIATEVQNILTEGRRAVELRGKVTFPSPEDKDNPKILSAYFPLTAIRLQNEPLLGSFKPVIEMSSTSWRRLKFSVWWNEVVFRASAALPGTPPGMIPVNGSPSVPYADRERLNRRQVIQFLRNHRGAHSLEEFPAILDEIDSPSSWGGFVMQDEQTGQQYSTDDGSLPWQAGQLAAMTREIAGEVLAAFALNDWPKDAPLTSSE